ncbi:CLUMA_CG016299, isoform A [Clunio marinus]|uniref:GCS light chain n=1 Tax=Clunio marinus TaxID=568069 RepID=A0A1J1IT86_9DIPT|nr:CLUMA_CG016299, isoform A [Clunio marinus]
MTSAVFNKYDSLVVGTGNILENEEFKKAKNPTQEMLICVKPRIIELEQKQGTLSSNTKDLVSLVCDETEVNGIENEAGSIKIVAKIFLNEFAENSLNEAIEYLLKNCSTTPSVILAYHPTSRTDSEKFIWADNNIKCKGNFKFLWKKLRVARDAGIIGQLGIADMDLDTILDIFDDKNFDFTILQINTQTCCVVPPELQQFCKDHDIQLLTHSDPQVIFPSHHLDEISLKDFKMKWTVRYLETLVCRGILTKKGFIVKFVKALNVKKSDI